MVFSPRHQIHGQCVLLTGVSGFLGSVVLEQLLRLTQVGVVPASLSTSCLIAHGSHSTIMACPLQVKTVYVLVRGKKHVSAAKRVQDLLCSPLFNLLHQDILAGKRNPFSRVHTVEGDLTNPGLGLSHQDLRLLRSNVNIVLHCAALVELETHVQQALRHNYLGTWELMRVASQMDALHAFVHVSTTFVNNHLPRNSLVKERIYPLQLEVDGEPVGHR